MVRISSVTDLTVFFDDLGTIHKEYVSHGSFVKHAVGCRKILKLYVCIASRQPTVDRPNFHLT